MSGSQFSFEQGWSTLPVPNIRRALYGMSIRSVGTLGLPLEVYIFPLPPQQLRKDSVAMNTIYDTQGSPGVNGVQRLVDQFGQALPIYTMEGTTGWKLHNSDGFIFDGQTAASRLENMFAKFASLNQQQMQSNQSQLYTMEFYDFFRLDFYEIVPIGPQGFRQMARQPLNTYYQLRFAAVRDLSAAIESGIDSVAQSLFGVSPLASINSVSSSLTSLLNQV
jgi:hypothetical protein